MSEVKALGKPFEGPNSSWHDIPEQIMALRARLEKMEKAAAKLLDAYGEAHALYDLGDCEGSVEVRAALAQTEEPRGNAPDQTASSRKKGEKK